MISLVVWKPLAQVMTLILKVYACGDWTFKVTRSMHMRELWTTYQSDIVMCHT